MELERDFYSEIDIDDEGDWYWRIRSAGNHETILHSESHANRGDVADIALRFPFLVWEITPDGRVLLTRDGLRIPEDEVTEAENWLGS